MYPRMCEKLAQEGKHGALHIGGGVLCSSVRHIIASAVAMCVNFCSSVAEIKRLHSVHASCSSQESSRRRGYRCTRMPPSSATRDNQTCCSSSTRQRDAAWTDAFVAAPACSSSPSGRGGGSPSAALRVQYRDPYDVTEGASDVMSGLEYLGAKGVERAVRPRSARRW